MLTKRNVYIDLVKCVAVLSVISVYFFANTGFYGKNIWNFNTYLMVFFRTLFMICVPLFMITIGYFMFVLFVLVLSLSLSMMINFIFKFVNKYVIRKIIILVK